MVGWGGRWGMDLGKSDRLWGELLLGLEVRYWIRWASGDWGGRGEEGGRGLD